MNTALGDYGCTVIWPQTDNIIDRSGWDEGTSTGTIITDIYSYDDFSYSWYFTPDSTWGDLEYGTHTFSQLNAGMPNRISGFLTASCIETHTREIYTEKLELIGYDVKEYPPIWDIVGENEDGTPKYDWITPAPDYIPKYDIVSKTEEITLGYDTSEITTEVFDTVYTRPGIFSDYNFIKDVTIITSKEDGLSVERVDRWCNHCGKYLSWKEQEDKYSAADFCKIIVEEDSLSPFISAEWYNQCGELCGLIDKNNPDDLNRVSNNPNKKNSLITAEVFIKLGKAISISGQVP